MAKKIWKYRGTGNSRENAVQDAIAKAKKDTGNDNIGRHTTKVILSGGAILELWIVEITLENPHVRLAKSTSQYL